MVSLKDVAQACGVSVATVSKALNGHSDVGADTAKRIKETAKAMGYLPNTAARALKTNKTNNLGVLFCDDAQSGLTHTYFSSVLEGFRKAAEDKDYDITFISNNQTTHNLSYYERCRSRGVDGIVIACVSFDTPQIQEILNGNIPVVTIDRVFDTCTSIVSDNARGMHDLVEYAISMGHKKIAYVHGKPSAVTETRLESYYGCLKAHGIAARAEYVVEGDYLDSKACYDRTLELLRLDDRPTCIIYPDDLACIGGINAIRSMGLSIPGDVSVMGYDGAQIGQVISPRFTTLKQDTKLIGGTAADKLINIIEHPESEKVEKVVIEGQLLEGASVKKLI